MASLYDIREFAVDALQGLNATIHNGRGYAVNGAAAPYVSVYTPKNRYERATIKAPVTFHVATELVVEYVNEAASVAIDNELDDMVSEISIVLLSNPTMGGTVISLDLSDTETVVSTDEGAAKPLGFARLSFVVQHRIQVGAQ